MRFWETGNSGGSTPSPGTPIIKVVGLDAAEKQYPLTLGPGLAITGNVLDVTGSGGSGYSAEAEAYFARLTGTYANAWKLAVDNELIKPMVAAGIWGLRDAIYSPHTENFSDSLLNLKGNDYPLALSGDITNSITGGWNGNGGTLTTAYTAQSGQYTQNNGGFDAWILEQNLDYTQADWQKGIVCGFYILGGSNDISCISAQAPNPFFGLPMANKTYGTHHSAGASGDYASILPAITDFVQINRSSATEFSADFGAANQLISSNSVTPNTSIFRIMPYGFGGRVGLVSVGASLNATQRNTYRTIVSNFLNVIGAS